MIKNRTVKLEKFAGAEITVTERLEIVSQKNKQGIWIQTRLSCASVSINHQGETLVYNFGDDGVSLQK